MSPDPPSELEEATQRLMDSPVEMMFERILAAERYQSAKRRELYYEWSLGDLASAHRMLDYYDETDAIQKKKAEEQTEEARNEPPRRNTPSL